MAMHGAELPQPAQDDVLAARRVLRLADQGALGDGREATTPDPPRLTAREREVLRWVASGYTDKAIAAALSVSPRTVSNHVASILRKLGVETRRGAARRAIRDALVPPLPNPTAAPESGQKNE